VCLWGGGESGKSVKNGLRKRFEQIVMTNERERESFIRNEPRFR
jgi:hypothetical protein